jgi:hypothetical protein
MARYYEEGLDENWFVSLAQGSVLALAQRRGSRRLP